MKKFPIQVEETRQIKRITFKQSVFDLLNAFNIERGLIYTLKLLMINPALIINQYLFEGRFKIFNAFRLLILTTAVSLGLIYLAGLDQFMSDFAVGYNSEVPTEELEKSTKMSNLMTNLFFEWYNLFLWISIPIYAFLTYLFFARSYNYAEHIVIQTFYICALNLIASVFFPIYLATGYESLTALLFLISTVYYFFFIIKVFRLKKLTDLLKVFLLFIVSNVAYFLVLLLILGIFIGYEIAKTNAQ